MLRNSKPWWIVALALSVAAQVERNNQTGQVGQGPDPKCSCQQYFKRSEYDPKQSRNWCYPASAPFWYMRSVAQAQFYCTNMAKLDPETGITNCTKFILVPVNATVKASQEQPKSWQLLYRMITTVDSQEDDVYPCPDAYAKLANRPLKFELVWSRTAGYWLPSSKCLQSICPEAPLTRPVTDASLQRFVNLNPSDNAHRNKLVCNIDACPNCQCKPASKACTCDTFHTGGSCQFNKLEWCCWPPQSKPVDAPMKNCGPRGVCGFQSNEQKGISVCQSIRPNEPPTCQECQADYLVDNKQQPSTTTARQAMGGPRCNVSACQAGCGGGGAITNGWCLSTCEDTKTKRNHWCWLCEAQQTCRRTGAECRCRQDNTQFFVGESCKSDASNAVPYYEDSPLQPLPPNAFFCHTQYRIDTSRHAWIFQDYEDPNPYECAAHGTCMVQADGRGGKCSCINSFLDASRCFRENRCITQCVADQTRATCNFNTDFECICQPTWYSPPAAQTDKTKICSVDGCDVCIARPPEKSLCAVKSQDGQTCTCPSIGNIRTIWSGHTVDSPNTFVGCRVQCPFNPKTNKECGDGFEERCTKDLFYLGKETPIVHIPVPRCDCGLRILQDGKPVPRMAPSSNDDGSCEPYCVNGTDKYFDTMQQCVCDVGRNPKKPDETFFIYSGARCNISICQHGSQWNHQFGICDCSLADEPYRELERDYDDNPTCTRNRCLPHRHWDPITQNCECTKPREWDVSEQQCLCLPPLIKETCCQPTQIFKDNRCQCKPNYVGEACLTSLCQYESTPLAILGCECKDPVIVGGKFCNESNCFASNTIKIEPTKCVCKDSLFETADRLCSHDLCSALYVDAGQPVYDSIKKEWHCQCQDFVPLQPYQADDEVVSICGCPYPQMLLDPCFDDLDPSLPLLTTKNQNKQNNRDGRCVLKRADAEADETIYRCICAQGHRWTNRTCVPLQCFESGTDPLYPYRKIDGQWTCRCRYGWSGPSCDNFVPEPILFCGNGTIINATYCKCHPNAHHEYDAETGQFCALNCENESYYSLLETRCVCGTRFFGDLCQFAVPDPSSTGLPEHEEPLLSESASFPIGLAVFVAAVALLLIVWIVLSWLAPRTPSGSRNKNNAPSQEETEGLLSAS